MALELNTIAPAKGSRKRRKRVGCGESSGHGKTSCRGGKGQKGRSGAVVKPGFEGGQMTLVRRMPKLGFRSHDKVTGRNRFVAVNLNALEAFEAGATVDAAALAQRGFGSAESRFKVLGDGKLSKKLTVVVSGCSASAKAQIEKLGGSVTIAA
jgi:large subunit ribosomal protein L15